MERPQPLGAPEGSIQATEAATLWAGRGPGGLGVPGGGGFEGLSLEGFSINSIFVCSACS